MSSSIWDYREAQSIGDLDAYSAWLRRHPQVLRSKIMMLLLMAAILMAPAALLALVSSGAATVMAVIAVSFSIGIGPMVWVNGTGISLGDGGE